MSTHKGLINIGATCYINSFIQTLFMTPQFRDGIYQWTYNQKLHPKPQDSILYQLQKLFAKLQLGHTDICVKDLVRSFQWQDEEFFNQQDIQQFNRVLFQALEVCFGQGKNDRHLVKQLYQGELVHFTKCLQCMNQSHRQQKYQDIILIIKNIYQKIYNNSLQLSLQRYIKPQQLDHNNMYDCPYCNKKTMVQRGIKFVTMPSLLNMVLQRFHFDYQTLQRSKINDKFSFPFVVNFNHYFNGYQMITNKLNQDSSEYFLNQYVPLKDYVRPTVPKLSSKKVVSKAGTTSTQPAVAGKIKTKPSANTKSFLMEMRKKKMQQSQNQDLIYVSGNATVDTSLPVVKKEIEPSKRKPTQNLQNTSTVTKNQTEIQQKNQQVPILASDFPLLPPPPPIPALSTPFSKSDIPITSQTIQTQFHQKQLLKQQQAAQSQQLYLQHQQQTIQLIQQYLQDGPLVYQLYSIMVHTGTVNGGHYYSYIKSNNNKWYHFNDDVVKETTIADLHKTYGGQGTSNAYMLYYRLHQVEPYKMQSKIPQYIYKVITEQQQNLKIKRLQSTLNLQSTLILKIYFMLGVKTIQINKNSHLQLLYQKCLQLFNIVLIKDESQAIKTKQFTYIKHGNIRIRLFNPVNDTKLDTYRQKMNENLFQLGVRSYQNFILETKTDSQEFQDYVAGFTSIRLALHEDNRNIVSLDQKNLKLHKISINKSWTMQTIQSNILARRTQILSYLNPDQIKTQICIIKRHQNDQYLYHQIINMPQYHIKTMQQIGIFQNQIIFVQSDKDILYWPGQFQNQIHRIEVKYINASTQQSSTILTDSRILLSVLKTQICELIQQSPLETIVRRGNRSGLELKNSQVSLKANRFISGTTLYLQKGLPAKQGQIRIQLFLSTDASPQLYNRLHEFEFIGDVPIDTTLKASQVKARFAQILLSQREIKLTSQQFRIRQKVNDKMGKVYRQKPMKQQQLIQKRQIAIEIKEDKMQNKDFSIYVRVWNQLQWKLSPKIELIVNKSTTLQQLSVQISNRLKNQYSQYSIQAESMDICRILSIHKFSILDLVDMQYFGMNSDASVLVQPMFVNSDGLLYIVKQTGIQPRELTKQQQQIFGGKIKTVTKPTKGRPVVPANVKKEKGISIKVVQKQKQEQSGVILQQQSKKQ